MGSTGFNFIQFGRGLLNDGKDFLRELQGKARQGVSMLEVRHENLEEILSFALASEGFNTGYPNQDNDEYIKLCFWKA